MTPADHRTLARTNGLLAHDPTVDTVYHRPDDRFVPLRTGDIAAAIAADKARFGPLSACITQVAEAIEDVVDQEAHAFERLLYDRYVAVNPDRDTMPVEALDAERTPQHYADLNARLEYLLGKANFERLGDAQIDAAVHAANSHGLRIRLRPDRIQSVSVWVRGHSTIERTRGTLRHPFRGVTRTLPVYRRLVVVARLRDDPNVVLKLFKEIPVVDVEALLPHAEVRMSLFDRIKVMGGGAGMAGSTAAKLLNVVANFAYWSKMIWVLVIGGAVLAIRTLLGYRNARELRDSQRTRHLYYQNLDNNVGVLHSLVSMVAHEDAKEALLAYVFCHAATRPVESIDDLSGRVETFLRDRFKIRADFDTPDGVRTLARLGLWADAARFRVLPPDAAIDRLRSHWRGRHTMHCHEQAAALR